MGQNGRTTHRWWIKGERAPGLCDRRLASAYIFAAVRPATGEDFALVIPPVSAAAMEVVLGQFAKRCRTTSVGDGVRWSGLARRADIAVPGQPDPGAAAVPCAGTQPGRAPWLYLRKRYLSHRLVADEEAVVDACCRAWNALTAETGRIQALCAHPNLAQVAS